MPSRATSIDVARLAGVSQPTVSRVFGRDTSVSPDKAERVRQAADQLGYKPNTLARSLTSGRSRTIGIVLAYLDNPFYPAALQRLSERLSEENYHVMVFFAANQADEVDGVVEGLVAHQIDGIILASVSLSAPLTERIRALNIPFVLFNRGQEDEGLPSVTATNVEGARKAAHFLADADHTRIAHISGWLGSLTGRQRQEGFIAGLQEKGLEPLRCTDSYFQRDLAIEATLDLFNQGDTPDAIFVGNDHMAFAVLETLQFTLGLDVPGDVSVIGFDDVDMASWQVFDLTTLRQPARRMVDVTVRVLLDAVEHGLQATQSVEIESDLIVRGSARLPDGVTRSCPLPTSPKTSGV